MAVNMFTDCSSIQGSTASSSSDVMTLATTASWCAISIPSTAAAVAASTRLRILRLIRPHARRILVTPDTSPSFGFAVRGGKEFGTGFFISSVERNSEAELKGMRIGDQILRINGFRVDDAIHRELIQFITNQDRITLKVRSVGMLPIKEKDTDKLSWHAVKTFTNGSSASSESSYRTLPERDTRSKDVNITLNVAPRTKLGLGICKGPEWKPGIFVQFTKEKSVAREAGLRQGDQILSVNSIDFSDVLFSEAVAVMKSASKLEMIVRTAAGCDLFPGESSGYNSSASSVTGDQSPCWADAKSKRLTSVREEPTPVTCWNEAAYAEQHRRGEPLAGSSKQRKDAQEKKPVVVSQQQQVNKTIIKLSEQGTSINNTFVSNTQQPMAASRSTSEYGTPKVRGAVGSHEAQRNSSPSTYASLEERETKTVIVEVHRQEAEEAKRQQQLQLQMQQKQAQPRTELNSHYHRNHSHNHSHNALQPTHSLPNHTPPTKQTEFQKCLRANSYSQQQQQQQQGQAQAQKLQQQQQQGLSHGPNTCQVDSSSLSSAITEELKKRKEKQRINAATANNNNNNNNNSHNYNGNNNTNSQSNYMNISSKQNNYGQSRQQQHQQQHHHNHTLHQPVALKTQQQQQPHSHSTPLSPSSSSLSLSAPPTTPTTLAAPATAIATATAALSARATSNNVNCSERNNHSHNNTNNNNNNSSNSSQSVPATGTLAIAGVGVGVGAGDQHSALMDEFKRAHQRMFKNGFQETERKERQEALRNTAIMEDDVNHRASRAFRNDNGSTTTTNGTQFQIPPPPPQFASSPPRTQPQYTNNGNNTNKFAQQPQAQQKPINHYNCAPTLKPPTEQPPKPPATPVPDYDNVEIRTKATTTICSSVRPSYGYASTNVVTNGRDVLNDNYNNHNNHHNNNSSNRRTLRAGTITIGEYEQPQQRREPGKFDFVGTPKRSSNSTTDVCADNLQAELQNTLTRSKLKKTAEPLEHQSHCPLRNNYENYENVARKLHSVSINEVATTAAPAAVRMSNCAANGGTNGILKNGNRHSGGGANGAKSSDKTITFGN
ncbi:PREDICTED: uncharacterized protein LOC108369112 [Rhagoletis zephyria]|uniref:uncharacterized protein LOC108369112 n=1 Tax=Rhagoletis zephyria TaxID=28612 RepID=UPI00081162D2|nr:PREDICTED: uncharacterized protein LOC108369112 [Rhagoletis zephyria]